MSISQRAAATSISSHSCIIKTLANKYHSVDNPEGYVNLAVADNALMHKELTDYVQEEVSWSSLVLSYGNGGSGSDQLRTAMAGLLNRYFKPSYSLNASQIFCTNGLTSAIEGMAFGLADQGEAFLLARPYYGSFPYVIGDRPGVKTVSVSFGDVDPFNVNSISAYEAALQKAKRDDGLVVRGIILCNPHNPTGRCYSVEYLQALLRFANKHKLHIISDEIYALSSWTVDQPGDLGKEPPTSFTSILAIDPTELIDPAYIHCLWGTSKDFGASGFRIGAIISPANPSLLAALSTRGLFTFPSATTDVVVRQLLADHDFVDRYMEENSRRLSAAYRLATDFLRKNDISFAQGGGAAFFLWVDLGSKMERIHGVSSSESNTITSQAVEKAKSMTNGLSTQAPIKQSEINIDIMARLVQQKVYLASGDAFGSEKPGWFRIVFAQEEDVVLEGLRRMIAALEGGKPKDIHVVEAMICCLCV